ncbi:hypothetical protein K435DRAFT_692249, partial [Dendrothele bispora CBS 962.96]
QRWSDNHFTPTTLAKLGLTIQLGHLSMYCRNPQSCHQYFRVLHTNGIHKVNLNFCGCERELPPAIQLLRRGLYPATHDVPKTVATFSLLKLLHHLSITSKGSNHDFYRTLERLTNNTGINIPKSRYAPLRRMTTQWRHLKLLKRGGRAQENDPERVLHTKDGELAVRCPSCPYPGLNIPMDLSQVPKEFWFLYRVLLVMDANFKLKNQLVSSYSRDPGLGVGWAYFVPCEKYEKYLLANIQEDEISTCVGFGALAQASTRFSRGMRSTGVGGVLCERTDMLMPNGLGNIPKGERYACMDFIFAYSLKTFVHVLWLLLSYDIACQWFVNLFARMSNTWSDDMRPTQILNSENVVPAVGKFHEPAHLQKDHEQYSFNLIAGVGHSNGEGPERLWAAHNAVAYSTKPMGPGSRQDVLDDHFAAWNWGKLIGMAHNGWTIRLPQHLVRSWEDICVTWEKAPFPKQVENPFEVSDEFLDEEEALKELEAEDAQRRAVGGVAWNDVSAPGFIAMGLELEQTWYRLRGIYMPGLLQMLVDLQEEVEGASSEHTNPEAVKLWLPSSIPADRRPSVCMPELVQIEDRLRTAQCNSALHALRHTLRVKSRMVLFKNANIAGQRPGLRSRAIIDRVHERAKKYAERYRRGREAKLSLIGPGDWEKVLRVLKNEDIRSYRDQVRYKKGAGRHGTNEDSWEPRVGAGGDGDGDEDEDEEMTLWNDVRPERRRVARREDLSRDGTGETRRINSWIWISGPGMNMEDGADEGNEICRSEWCRSRARARRATEEVLLLKEEMRRTSVFLGWKEKWWKDRAGVRNSEAGLESGIREGLTAYASKQASLYRELDLSFRALWTTPLQELDLDGGIHLGSEAEEDDDDDASGDEDDVEQ